MKNDKVKSSGIGTKAKVILILMGIVVALLTYLVYDKCAKFISEQKAIIAQKSKVVEIVQPEVKEELVVEPVVLDDKTIIQEYISKIHSYDGFVIPEFTNISSVQDKWIWNIAFQSFMSKNKYQVSEVSYTDIIKEAKGLFGETYSKVPEKIDYDRAAYSAETDSYTFNIRDNASFGAKYAITDINKTANGFEVKILEYTENYEKFFTAEPDQTYQIGIVGKSGKAIKQIDSDNHIAIEYYVLANKDKFNSKQIMLVQDNITKEVYVTSSKNV